MGKESNDDHVKLEREEAVQVIVAALQSGTLKLPCTTAFHQQLQNLAVGNIKKASSYYRGEEFSFDDILNGNYISQFAVPVRADGLFLLAFLEVLTSGISKKALSNFLIDATRE